MYPRDKGDRIAREDISRPRESADIFLFLLPPVMDFAGSKVLRGGGEPLRLLAVFSRPPSDSIFRDQPMPHLPAPRCRLATPRLSPPPNASAGPAIVGRDIGVPPLYNGQGGTVGPDLTGVRNQSADALLLHILVPNHEITPGYEAVAVTTRDGRTLSGWLASENENSLTLRTTFDTEETIARQNLESYSAFGVSLMPEGLEHTMSREELADVIAYLRQEAAPGRSAATP